MPSDREDNETRRDWDLVQENATDITERLRIRDGWLYRTTVKSGQVAMVFVPGAE